MSHCAMCTGGAEFFTNGGTNSNNNIPPKSSVMKSPASCEKKDFSQCIYSAQGTLVCGNGSKQNASSKEMFIPGMNLGGLPSFN